MEKITTALADEIGRLNAAIRSGAHVELPTFNGAQVVGFVRADLSVHCPKDNGGFGYSYMIANDGRWSDLLRQAGVTRNALFA